jgi:beta-glucosidase
MENTKLRAILDSLSLQEKIGQLIQLPGEFFQSTSMSLGPKEKLGISDEIVKNVGSVLNVMGAEKTREVQEAYLKESRHKIPLLFMADVIYGYQTIFPIPLGLGATWNPELIRDAYKIIGEEAHSGGVHVTFSPMVDLVRDARWGRSLESTGEDAFLNSQFSKAMVEGLQQNLTSKQGIASCVKHFAAYGASEAGRDYNTVDMSERRLRQDYLPSYKAAVEAGCELVMTSFNTYDGMPVSANEFLLKDILREEWGFDGVIISDYAAIRELIQHGVAKNNREAARLAMKASVDIDMKSPCYANELEPLIKDNEISEELINEAVWRVLKLKNRLGLFEDPYRGTDKFKEQKTLLNAEFRNFSKKVASESIVLLKNDKQVLPLTPNEDKILLVGPYGDSQELIGLWAIEGSTKDTVTLKSGLEKYLDSQNLAYEYGSEILESYDFLGEFGGKKPNDAHNFSQEKRRELLEQAIEAGKNSDVIIIAVGEHPMQSGEAGSQADIRLPKLQRRLIKEMTKLNKKTILVSFSGRPLELTEEEKNVDAMLHAWFPGTEGGNALADILFGRTNPSGKLSMSFPYSVGQLPIYYNEFNTGRPVGSKEHKGRFVSKYLDVPNGPLFPFGYGLSYSTIQYSHLEISDKQMKETLSISVTIENKSDYDCLETVQLYIRDFVGSVVRPRIELKQFKKVSLYSNEKKTVTFELTREDLKYYTRNLSFDVENGDFEVFVGPNSVDTLHANFELI